MRSFYIFYSRNRTIMYGNEANNQNQEIDCQSHTIPNQGPKSIAELSFIHLKNRLTTSLQSYILYLLNMYACNGQYARG